MREWPYTASSRDVLGRTSPPTLRFPSALGLGKSLGRRDVHCTTFLAVDRYSQHTNTKDKSWSIASKDNLLSDGHHDPDHDP